MKNPNGFGALIKLGGKRRKPYAVRITLGYVDHVCIQNKAKNYPIIDKYDMKYRKSKNDYTIECTDKIISDLNNAGIPFRIESKRKFKYLEYFSKVSDAHAYLVNMNSGEDMKEHVSIASEPSFKAVYDQYIDFLMSLNQKPTESRIRSYKTGFNLWSDVHDLRFRTITTKQLQDCLTAHGNLSKASVTRMITILKAMYKYAIAHKICDDDNSKYLFMEFNRETQIEHTPFTDDEIESLWKNKDDEIARLALILIYTGMRGSELLRLENKNINLKERYLIGGMKTEAGKDRTIPLHKDIVPLIKSFYDTNNTYLFPNKTGGYYSIEKFNQLRWRPYMDSVGIGHRTHDCRHTCATKLEALGINDAHRKLILGHKIRDITSGVYTHVSTKDLIKDIDRWPSRKSVKNG